jgi:hypothetical protein
VIGAGLSQATPVAPMSFNQTSALLTPQHAVSEYIATFLSLRYPRRAVQADRVLSAAVAVWLPGSALGIAPVLVWAARRVGWRQLCAGMIWLARPCFWSPARRSYPLG